MTATARRLILVAAAAALAACTSPTAPAGLPRANVRAQAQMDGSGYGGSVGITASTDTTR